MGCIGLWWAVLCCAGLCWAIRGSTVLKPRHVHVKLLPVYTTHVKLLPVYTVVNRMCKDLQSWLEHGDAWWSLVQSCLPWSGLFKTDLARNGLVEPSNYPPSLVYTPTGQDWAGLRFAGLS